MRNSINIHQASREEGEAATVCQSFAEKKAHKGEREKDIEKEKSSHMNQKP